jgi:hypothetical protein
MAKSITYVGLDVHKDTIAVALAEAGLRPSTWDEAGCSGGEGENFLFRGIFLRCAQMGAREADYRGDRAGR